MSASLPELSLKIGKGHRPCVLDPAFMLSIDGITVARYLGGVAEFWLAREFWRILDNSDYFVRHPHELLPHVRCVHEFGRAISEWNAARLLNNLGGIQACWIGDNPSESMLPESVDPNVVQSFEVLATALDRRIRNCGAMASAMRDAAALAAVLRDACVLSWVPVDLDGTDLPPICSALQDWGIPCRCINAADPLATIEREHWGNLLVSVGLPQLVWGGLRLALVRLLLPNAPLLRSVQAEVAGIYAVDAMNELQEVGLDPWGSAQAFWHTI